MIKSIRKESKLFFDVHLMVTEPERYIRDFVECGADSITVHAEACEDLERTIEQIRDCLLYTSTFLCAFNKTGCGEFQNKT